MTSQKKITSNIIVNAHVHQKEIFFDKTRNKVVVTGRRWGKSVLGREEALKTVKQVPGSLVWIVAPTREMAKDIHWDALKERVRQLNWRVKINETELSVKRLKDNSKIVLKTADNPDRLRGRGLTKVIVDEFRDMQQSVWNAVLRPSLAESRGGVLFISTTNGYDVLHELYVLGQGHDPDWKSWTYKTIDSPFISADEIEKARTELDEKTFRQEFEASFETATGRVYYAFDRKQNISEKKLDDKRPLILCVDFNVSPCVWSVIQHYGEGDYVIDEIVKHDTNTTEMTKEFIERYVKPNPRIQVFIYGDYSGTSRHTSSMSTDFDVMKDLLPQAHINIKPNPQVVDRVNATNARLCNAKGERRLFVAPKCKTDIKDFEQVLWKEGKREIDKGNIELTHGSDGIGYYCEYEYSLKGKPTSEWRRL